GLLGRIKAIKFIRHTAFRHLQSRPHRRRSPAERTRFKVLIYLKRFGAGACGALVSTSKVLAQMNKTQDVGRATEGCSALQSRQLVQSEKGRIASDPALLNLPRPPTRLGPFSVYDFNKQIFGANEQVPAGLVQKIHAVSN